jgi:hypothetical protein
MFALLFTSALAVTPKEQYLADLVKQNEVFPDDDDLGYGIELNELA